MAIQGPTGDICKNITNPTAQTTWTPKNIIWKQPVDRITINFQSGSSFNKFSAIRTSSAEPAIKNNGLKLQTNPATNSAPSSSTGTLGTLLVSDNLTPQDFIDGKVLCVGDTIRVDLTLKNTYVLTYPNNIGHNPTYATTGTWYYYSDTSCLRIVYQVKQTNGTLNVPETQKAAQLRITYGGNSTSLPYTLTVVGYRNGEWVWDNFTIWDTTQSHTYYWDPSSWFRIIITNDGGNRLYGFDVISGNANVTVYDATGILGSSNTLTEIQLYHQRT